MPRRTRQQIASESLEILNTFNDIRHISEMGDLDDSQLQHELNDIVLSRVGEGAFDEIQKQTLWQIATQDDIEELTEKYLPQKDSAQEKEEVESGVVGLSISSEHDEKIGKEDILEDRPSESKSDHSDKIALNLLSSRIGKLSQTLGFGVNRQNGKVEFEVEFGVQRPGGVQDRHISAYMMMLEVFKSRLTGMEVEDAIEVIPEIVGEYLVEDSPGMKQFLDYSRQQKDLLALQGVLSKDDRKQVYDIECATLSYLQNYTHFLEERLKSENEKVTKNSGLVEFLEEDLKNHTDLLAQEEEKREIVSPMDSRNKYKEADLWKYQECFSSTLKAAVVTMNKMEMVSFKGEETAVDRGKQGVDIKNAAARLRDKGNWEEAFIDIRQNINDIITFFDYPKSEVKKLSEDMVDPEQVSRLFNRHMKLTYDSFDGLRDMDQSKISNIMRGSFSKFKEKQGWPTKKGQYPYPNSHENIDTEKHTYTLSEKFFASKSRSLTTAIKDLETQIKSGIEDQVEEEQNKVQEIKESSGQRTVKTGGGRI